MVAVRWMLLLSVAACADEVQVRVSVPETYREGIVSLVLHVLDPPASAPFDCDDVAYDDVLPGALELSETWLASLDEPGSEYIQLDRRADKRLWVEGVDATGLPLVEGCAELGYVGSDRVVNIELEPTVILDLFGTAENLSGVLRDYRGEARVDATVAWRRVEPGGLITEGSAQTDERGRTPIALEPAVRSGPSLLEFMVRWSRTGKTAYQGFAIPPVLGPIPFPNVSSSAAGRIGPDGTGAAVGVFDSCDGTPGDWGTALVSVSAGGELETEPLHGCVRGGVPPAVAALPVSQSRELIVTLSNSEWRTLAPSTSGVTEIESGSVPLMVLPPKALYPVGPCDGATDEVLAVAVGGISLGVFRIPTEDGVPAVRVTSGPFASVPGSVGGSGCVSDGAGGERRVVLHTVEHNDKPQHRMIVADVAGPGSCQYRWDSIPPVTTPTMAMSAGVERHLVYAVVKAGVGDLEVQAARLDLTGGGCRPLATVRESLPALPVSLQSGDMDGDGLLDLVAVIGSYGLDDEDRWVFRERVWASLGVEHNGTRLTGTSKVIEDILVTRLAIYDADGDGLDDVMMIGEQQPTGVPVALGVLMGMSPEP